ncbi:MAG TPA: hypothetical protein VMD99_02480 [Terriglobales bacterium]|nr:hypothetical protein [Terriglobales bacterium]
MTIETVELRGGLGQYTYLAYPINTTFKDEPGNYIYAKRNAAGKWQAVYIGQSSSLSQRLASLDAEQAAIRFGATHILAHLNSDERARKSEEADLINTLAPPLITAAGRAR